MTVRAFKCQENQIRKEFELAEEQVRDVVYAFLGEMLGISESALAGEETREIAVWIKERYK